MVGKGFLVLLSTSLKAYYRNRQAIFFGFIFPLVFMGIFGLLNFGGAGKLDIGIADQASNPQSQAFIKAVQDIKSVNVHTGSEGAEKSALQLGHRDAVAVLPPEFGAAVQPGAPASPVTITTYLNSANPAAAQTARIIVDQVATGFSFATLRARPPYVVRSRELPGKTLTYIDTLIPGIIGFSIMQTGIFSLAFALVRLRDAGVLRRMLATPMRITDFMAAQVLSRLIMGVAQILLLLAVSFLLFKFQMRGNLVEFVAVATFGSTIFIALGFIIAGASKNEDSVPRHRQHRDHPDDVHERGLLLPRRLARLAGDGLGLLPADLPDRQPARHQRAGQGPAGRADGDPRNHGLARGQHLPGHAPVQGRAQLIC